MRISTTRYRGLSLHVEPSTQTCWRHSQHLHLRTRHTVPEGKRDQKHDPMLYPTFLLFKPRTYQVGHTTNVYYKSNIMLASYALGLNTNMREPVLRSAWHASCVMLSHRALRCRPPVAQDLDRQGTDDDVEIDFAAEGDTLSQEQHRLHTSRKTLQGGQVYFVSTPIGNLEDITLRAIRTLQQADVVASEDTRVTASLLRHLGIRRKRLISHHEHNVGRSLPLILDALTQNLSVAVVSDAGTPCISDPGFALASESASRGFPVVSVPGPCAAVAAVSVCGYDAREFTFFGFLPRTGRNRREKLAEVASERRACVLYEAPHRIVSVLEGLAAAGAARRPCVCARELTKIHEESYRGEVGQAAQFFSAIAEREGRVRGEFTVVLGPMEQAAARRLDEEDEAGKAQLVTSLLRAELTAGVSVSRAAKSVSAAAGVPKVGCDCLASA